MKAKNGKSNVCSKTGITFKPSGNNNHKPLLSKKIYIDTKGQTGVAALEKDLALLGACIEKFFTKDVHYLVTGQKECRGDGITESSPSLSTPSPFNLGSVESPKDSPGVTVESTTESRGKALAQKARSKFRGTTDVIANAQKWNVRVVSFTAVQNWVKREIGKLPSCANKTTQKKAKPTKVKHLQSPFLKFESTTKQYKPNFVQLETFPHLDLSRGVLFGGEGAQKVQGAGLGASDPGEEPDEVNSPLKTPKSAKKSKQLSKSSEKLMTAGELRRMREEKRRAELKRGYCECCNERYDNIDEHVQSDKHQEFVRQPINFRSLDLLIARGPNIERFLHDVEMFHTSQAEDLAEVGDDVTLQEQEDDCASDDIILISEGESDEDNGALSQDPQEVTSVADTNQQVNMQSSATSKTCERVTRNKHVNGTGCDVTEDESLMTAVGEGDNSQEVRRRTRSVMSGNVVGNVMRGVVNNEIDAVKSRDKSAVAVNGSNVPDDLPDHESNVEIATKSPAGKSKRKSKNVACSPDESEGNVEFVSKSPTRKSKKTLNNTAGVSPDEPEGNVEIVSKSPSRKSKRTLNNMAGGRPDERESNRDVASESTAGKSKRTLRNVTDSGKTITENTCKSPTAKKGLVTMATSGLDETPKSGRSSKSVNEVTETVSTAKSTTLPVSAWRKRAASTPLNKTKVPAKKSKVTSPVSSEFKKRADTLQRTPESRNNVCGTKSGNRGKKQHKKDDSLSPGAKENKSPSVTASGKKFKLKEKWKVLSNRSMCKIFQTSEFDEPFSGFPDRNTPDLPTDVSYVDLTEIEVDDVSDADWFYEGLKADPPLYAVWGIDLDKSLADPSSDYEWDSPCEIYLRRHVEKRLTPPINKMIMPRINKKYPKSKLCKKFDGSYASNDKNNDSSVMDCNESCHDDSPVEVVTLDDSSVSQPEVKANAKAGQMVQLENNSDSNTQQTTSNKRSISSSCDKATDGGGGELFNNALSRPNRKKLSLSRKGKPGQLTISSEILTSKAARNESTDMMRSSPVVTPLAHRKKKVFSPLTNLDEDKGLRRSKSAMIFTSTPVQSKSKPVASANAGSSRTEEDEKADDENGILAIDEDITFNFCSPSKNSATYSPLKGSKFRSTSKRYPRRFSEGGRGIYAEDHAKSSTSVISKALFKRYSISSSTSDKRLLKAAGNHWRNFSVCSIISTAPRMRRQTPRIPKSPKKDMGTLHRDKSAADSRPNSSRIDWPPSLDILELSEYDVIEDSEDDFESDVYRSKCEKPQSNSRDKKLKTSEKEFSRKGSVKKSLSFSLPCGRSCPGKAGKRASHPKNKSKSMSKIPSTSSPLRSKFTKKPLIRLKRLFKVEKMQSGSELNTSKNSSVSSAKGVYDCDHNGIKPLAIVRKKVQKMVSPMKDSRSLSSPIASTALSERMRARNCSISEANPSRWTSQVKSCVQSSHSKSNNIENVFRRSEDSSEIDVTSFAKCRLAKRNERKRQASSSRGQLSSQVRMSPRTCSNLTPQSLRHYQLDNSPRVLLRSKVNT